MWFKEFNVRYHNGRRLSARAIIVRDGCLLAFHRKRLDNEEGAFLDYYSIPGGGVDKGGESIEEACVRELKEELGVDIELKAKVAVKLALHHENHVFYAEIVNGEPHFMKTAEEAQFQNKNNQFKMEWVPVSQLTADNMLFYRDFLPIIQAIARGEVPSEPVQLQED